MSIPKRPYIYTPSDFFDCGIAGEHPVEFMSWLSDDGPENELRVDILCVTIRPTISNPKGQTWIITEEIKKYPERLRRYEDEIREDYLAKLNKDWEAGA